MFYMNSSQIILSKGKKAEDVVTCLQMFQFDIGLRQQHELHHNNHQFDCDFPERKSY